MKLQKGYLLIIVVILIVIIGFVGGALVYFFTSTTGSVSKFTQADRALYVAMSGLEQAKRDVIVNGVACASVLVPATAPVSSGVYNIAGVANVASTTLVSINLDNTMTLTSTAGLSGSGLVAIDNEVIGYSGVSGNNLQNIVRAVYGASSVHLSGANVTQNQCTLTSIGMVPSATAIEAKRTVKETLVGASVSVPGSLLNLPGGLLVTPGLISLQNIRLIGNSLVRNSYVTTGSTGFPGSTILTASDSVVLNGNGATQVNNGSGGWATASNKNGIGGDIMKNVPIDSSNLFGYVFDGQTKNSIYSSSLTYKNYNGDNIDGAVGKTIWVSGDLQISAKTQIGTPTKPVILIVDGNVDISGQAAIYGLLYSTKGVSMSGLANVSGAVVIEGALNLNGNNNTGNVIINMDQSILTNLQLLNSSTTVHYQTVPNNFQEVFQ